MITEAPPRRWWGFAERLDGAAQIGDDFTDGNQPVALTLHALFSHVPQTRQGQVMAVPLTAGHPSCTVNHRTVDSPEDARATIPKVASENIGGPYLTAALFCDKVLQERSGVLSLIRVIDRWNIAGPSETMPTTSIQTVLCMSFKSGIFRGPADVTVTPIGPNGNRLRTMIREQINFEGDNDRGINLTVNMTFPVTESGLYWFEIAVQDEVFTRTPLRVLYQRTRS